MKLKKFLKRFKSIYKGVKLHLGKEWYNFDNVSPKDIANSLEFKLRMDKYSQAKVTKVLGQGRYLYIWVKTKRKEIKDNEDR